MRKLLKELFVCNNCGSNFELDVRQIDVDSEFCPGCNSSDIIFKDGSNISSITLEMDLTHGSEKEKEEILKVIKDSLSKINKLTHLQITKDKTYKIPF